MNTEINDDFLRQLVELISTNNTIRTLIVGPESFESLNSANAAWALLCAFIIITMETGFALFESGCVSSRNGTNIMVKSCTTLCLGGLSYWLFGYGFSFGKSGTLIGRFTGYDQCDFAFRSCNAYFASDAVHFFFHLTFAVTTTTIVSGAVAERVKYHAWIIFAFFNTLAYCFPSHWAWDFHHGFLTVMGFYDFAGGCMVHLNGGACALVACVIIGPRLGRFEFPEKFIMRSPVTALHGTLILWFAWLGFNCGSSYGIGGKDWRISAAASVTTINGSIGGGICAMIISMLLNKGG